MMAVVHNTVVHTMKAVVRKKNKAAAVVVRKDKAVAVNKAAAAANKAAAVNKAAVGKQHKKAVEAEMEVVKT